jgi:hypothetical protein
LKRVQDGGREDSFALRIRALFLVILLNLYDLKVTEAALGMDKQSALDLVLKNVDVFKKKGCKHWLTIYSILADFMRFVSDTRTI